MMIIKTFESFDDSYKQITNADASNAFQNRGGWENLTEDEKSQITKFVKSIGGKDLRINKATTSYIHPKTGECIVANKGKDEYYYVMDDSTQPGTWYECDRLEGLIKCLRSI